MGSDAESPDALVIRANKLDILERLADDLAHEIKNPLHSMVINLEVLRRRAARGGEDDGGDLQRYIGVLGAELERVTGRIELLLRLSRPARRAEPATLDELVHELLELIQLEGRRHEVEVRFEPAYVPAPVHVPREPVRQVILDLVLEALDGAPPGGSLVIRTSRDGDLAAVSVSVLAPDGTPLALPDDGSAPAGATVARLPAARAVADAVGGRLELNGAGEGTGSPALVFSIPVAGR
ncbi:MAG TPA: histidine kinase dimerization/phospho-acceptor domain-containing protein [Longimicrobiaceae bacterium]|nr:histidine kinase dimerization/phospho-acceptor domain-containing protein [Longimicrobiaceae bacterium]